MYERILVLTDGSDVAEAAAEAAISLADRFDADLHVVHVLEVGEVPPGAKDEDVDQFATRDDASVATVVERAADAGIDATSANLDGRGPIHRTVLAYADEHDADCVVMGTHGRTGLDRLVLGSVAERTLRESPVPVVTLHEDTVVDPELETILVPTDGSDSAEAAVDHAVDLAVATGAALQFVTVVDSGAVWDETDPVVLDVLEEEGAQALEALVDRAETAGVSTVGSSVLSGRPHQAIVDYAAEHDVDCVVMGTHGRTGFDRLVLGSVTERVVRLTDVPVVALKRGDPAD